MKPILKLILFCLFNLGSFLTIADGLDCKYNRFWAVSNISHTIEEFEIVGNTIISHGVIATCPGGSISYSDNLDNNIFTPTFYTTITIFNPGAEHVVLYYNGSTWDTSSAVINMPPGGCGGFGNSVYFSFSPSELIRFDGNTVTHLPLNTVTIADVAVDEEENAWIISCTTAYNANEIRVMEPSGQIIRTFTLNTPVTFTTPYGCFLLNGVLYVGQGTAQTLTPITFSGNIATVGTPLNMPPGNFSDLASCKPGSFFSAISSVEEKPFHIYPNPSENVFRFSSKEVIKEISVKNVLGDEIILTDNNEIDLSDFPDDIYFYQLTTTKSKIYNGKIIKQ